ncbi:MAG TPA: hypothetical protein VNM45_22175 [Bacillus sp. (in: firmicutes)]|nr:hypothetical protein [Bacillus sp. (in: firmicutes)]
MKFYKTFLAAMMVLPWISVPFIGKNEFKRFLPASLLMSLFVTAESFYARKRTWWWVYKKLHPRVIGEIPLIVGPFFVGSLWILKCTYRKFPLYMAVNLIVHWLFAYPIMDLFKRTGLGSTVRLKRIQLFSLFFFKSLILYGMQWFIEKSKNR